MKNTKRFVCVLLAFVIVLSLVPGAMAVTYESGSGKFQKISHQDNGLKTVDGIVDYVGNGAVSALDQGQGDRGQNYSWSAVGYGDDVYIGTCYNAMGNTLTFMDSVLGHDFRRKR